MQALKRDLKPYVIGRYNSDEVAVTAGGSGDNTAIDGDAVDVTALDTKVESCLVVVTGQATVASGQTLTVKAKFQQSADGSTGWTDVDGAEEETILTLSGATTDKEFYGSLNVDVSKMKDGKYLKSVVTPDLSASGTDTANIQTVLVFSGLGARS